MNQPRSTDEQDRERVNTWVFGTTGWLVNGAIFGFFVWPGVGLRPLHMFLLALTCLLANALGCMWLDKRTTARRLASYAEARNHD